MARQAGVGAQEPSDALNEKRYVFVISGTGVDMLDGSAVEVRSESADRAIYRTNDWEIVKGGGKLTLVGTREGFKSTARFYPLVPITAIPMHIVRNERFAGDIPCDSLIDVAHCVLCDESGMRDAETARRERVQFDSDERVAS